MSIPCEYRKFLLNRLNVPQNFTEVLANFTNQNVEIENTFHKIMIHNWNYNDTNLFLTLNDFIGGTPFIPVNFIQGMGVCSFYTNSLDIINKIIKYDFIFPYLRSMFNIDVLFNDKTSKEIFGEPKSVSEIVEEIVYKRFSSLSELNLSNFCEDPEFETRKIRFYKFSLLSSFSTLMTKLGQETTVLNLSNNNLSEIPFDILNYFIKGSLIGINLSYNNLVSVGDLVRVTSKIRKLWLEGNPLCEGGTPLLYCKVVTTRFPILEELDGIPINQHGIIFPFWKNYIVNNNNMQKYSQLVVDKFMTLYFSHYDTSRNEIVMFYDDSAVLSIGTSFTEAEEALLPHYKNLSCNVNKLVKNPHRQFVNRQNIHRVLSSFPNTRHDPSMFTVDVMAHDKIHIRVVIDGIYKEFNTKHQLQRCYQFRRSIILVPYSLGQSTAYLIKYEIFSISFASKEMVDASFRTPSRNLNELSFDNPSEEETACIIKTFQSFTELKKDEVQTRLMVHNWDLKKALKQFIDDLTLNKILPDRFTYYDDMSSVISTDDELD